MSSWFATGPMVMYRPDAATVLVHPMRPAARQPVPTDVLGPLLGHARAAVLGALRDPATTTTTAVAERVGVSPATAGRHATNSRNAGLVDTVRTGIALPHSLTPLGRALLGA
ncbi:hypothetical protein [Streptomyces sp. NBC_00467]|uniref:hypothetical protein n=1 Tax=Streptomyces sp. NBC_00467 TaxID=2975752 RepID=UPI002E16F10A